eukprot:s462_g58.t1
MPESMSDRMPGGRGGEEGNSGSDFVALKLVLGPDTRLKTKFAAESDETKVKWLKAVASHVGDETPDLIYKDIRDRDNHTAPRVDILVSGAPCRKEIFQLHEETMDPRLATLLQVVDDACELKAVATLCKDIDMLKVTKDQQKVDFEMENCREVLMWVAPLFGDHESQVKTESLWKCIAILTAIRRLAGPGQLRYQADDMPDHAGFAIWHEPFGEYLSR